MTQLGLALDKPQQVIAFTPYSRTNGKAEYVEDIEQLQCRMSPPKRWLLATISLAYCRDGWRYGLPYQLSITPRAGREYDASDVIFNRRCETAARASYLTTTVER